MQGMVVGVSGFVMSAVLKEVKDQKTQRTDRQQVVMV
jgi:hypothetical protein